jgi:uncharacterized Zn finger protein
VRERRPVSLGERWRREANRGVDSQELERALAMLPSIRHPVLRIQGGSIHAEMEGSMGSINEVSIHVPTLPGRIWPQVARVLRRSPTMLEALDEGKVPRSFDRLVARIAGESLFPDARRVSSACTCGSPEEPCRHVLALHELFARRLDDRPWELLRLRGVLLADLLARAHSSAPDPDLPPLAFGASEEPVLFPEGEEGDLDFALSEGQVLSLLGLLPASVHQAVRSALEDYAAAALPDGEPTG